MPFPFNPFYTESCIKKKTRATDIRKCFVWDPGLYKSNKMFPDLACNRQEYLYASSDTAVK